MSRQRIMSEDEAKDLFIEELQIDKDLDSNYYVKFEEWRADNNIRTEEEIAFMEEDKMKEEYLRS